MGVIASISELFCGDGNQRPISADGSGFISLFASRATDLKPALTSDEDLRRAVGLALAAEARSVQVRRPGCHREQTSRRDGCLGG